MTQLRIFADRIRAAVRLRPRPSCRRRSPLFGWISTWNALETPGAMSNYDRVPPGCQLHIRNQSPQTRSQRCSLVQRGRRAPSFPERPRARRNPQRTRSPGSGRQAQRSRAVAGRRVAQALSRQDSFHRRRHCPPVGLHYRRSAKQGNHRIDVGQFARGDGA